MRICILGEVEELLRRNSVGGWDYFAKAFNAFRARHEINYESEICTMTKMWRYIISASNFSDGDRSVALSSLNDTDTPREWLVNFRQYVLCLLTDIYMQLEDYI